MTDPRQINTTFTLMGSSFIQGASVLIDQLRPGQACGLHREPNNQYDKNAVIVSANRRKIGYLPRQLARQIAPLMDSGVQVIARKAAPLPGFGAYRGILELAYIPPEAKETSNADAEQGASPSSDA